jgi:hypothetical protein
MSDKSTFFRNAVLNVLRATNITAPGTIYLSLHTASPGLTGTNEVTAGGNAYARQAIAFNAPSTVGAAQRVVSTAQEEFVNMPAATVTHVGLWDAVTTGNFLYKGALAVPRTTLAGDTLRFAAGDILFEET